MSKQIRIADDEPNIVAVVKFLLQPNAYGVHARNLSPRRTWWQQ